MVRTDLDTARVGKDHGSDLSEDDKLAIVRVFNRWIAEAVELSETARHTLAINIVVWQTLRDQMDPEIIVGRIIEQIERNR